MRRRDPFIKIASLIVEGVIAGELKNHPVLKSYPACSNSQTLLTIDLAEMKMILGKGTLKFELTRRCKCLILSPFLRMRVGGYRGTTWEEGNVLSLNL